MIKLKKVKPLLNHIITTADRYDNVQTKDGIIDTSKKEGDIKEVQKVLCVGPRACTDINIGDYVLINPMKYARPVHSLRENSVLEKDKDEVELIVNWPLVDIDDEERLFLYDTDIDLIAEDFEEVAEVVS